ncbi:hypothetical protein ACJX0J_024768, partial [Zea mays]
MWRGISRYEYIQVYEYNWFSVLFCFLFYIYVSTLQCATWFDLVTFMFLLRATKFHIYLLLGMRTGTLGIAKIIFFEITKQKYLEISFELGVGHDRAKTIDILVNDLKVFSTFNEEFYKEITQLVTLENFRF